MVASGPPSAKLYPSWLEALITPLSWTKKVTAVLEKFSFLAMGN